MRRGQGQSENTKFKHARFSPMFEQILRISQTPTIARFPFYLVDLHAGGGFNDRVNVPVPGSPLNFLKAVDLTGRHHFYAFFVDHDVDRIAELTRRDELARHAGRVFVHHGDNSEILLVVDEFISKVIREPNPQLAVGCIVIDPNGWHTGVPWDVLQWFCGRYRKFDVLFNLNVRQFWVEEHWIKGGEKGWSQHVLRPLSAFPTLFSRPNWMITEVASFGGAHWMQGVGRSMTAHSPDYRSKGFYDMQSERGQTIVANVEQRREIAAALARAQPSLLFDLR